MLPNAFVIIWDGKPVGLDSNSGGYPFKTEYAGNIKYWVTRKEAQDYINIMTMKETSSTYMNHYSIVEIQFRIIDKVIHKVDLENK